MIKNILPIVLLCFGSNCVNRSNKGTTVTPSKVVSNKPSFTKVVPSTNSTSFNDEPDATYKENSFLPSVSTEEETSDSSKGNSFSSKNDNPKNTSKVFLNAQLDDAIWNNNPILVKSLLVAGAEIEFSKNGYSNALATAKSKDKRILETLLIHLALRSQKDHEGLSPLHWAAKDGYPGVVKALMDSNQELDYNEVDPVYHFTPLHYAARKGNIEVVKMLLSKGAGLLKRLCKYKKII